MLTIAHSVLLISSQMMSMITTLIPTRITYQYLLSVAAAAAAAATTTVTNKLL